MSKTDEKGSKKAMLDFIESKDFLSSINDLIKSTGANITSDDKWMPEGIDKPKESTLNTFLRGKFDTIPNNAILKWWTLHGTRGPNWDLLSTCTINGERGVLLVEAKAHKGELDTSGKRLKKSASDNSEENHKNVLKAINQANKTINEQIEGVTISRDCCYQFSNRVAHAWWLADKGIPVVMLYLGFLNCTDMDNGSYKLFETDEDWQTCFRKHAEIVKVHKIVEEKINCGKSHFTTICRSCKLEK